MDSYETIAEYYDYEHGGFHEDIDFYRSLIDDGPVLEVGAGTGRIVESLAQAGIEIWGVEPSAAMLAKAKERLEATPLVRLVHSSVLDIDLGKQFSAVIMSLNTLWHLPDLASQLGAVEVAARHLLPGGLFIVDVSNPLTLADRGGCGEVRQRFRVATDEGWLTGFSAAWDDEVQQVLRIQLTYDQTTGAGLSRHAYAQLVLRYTYRFELELLLRSAGLDVRHEYGSYDLEPYTSSSPNLIVLAVPRESV